MHQRRWVVNFVASGKRLDGQVLPIPVKPLTLKAETAPVKTPPPLEPKEQGAPDWRMTAAIATGSNVVLLLAIWLTYRVMKKRSDAAIARLLGKLSP